MKHNTKGRKKRERESEKKKVCGGGTGRGGEKRRRNACTFPLAWRFAEVCTPLEPAVSLANDTSGASLGNGVRRAPGFHISSTRYFGIRKRGLWGTSFQELMWLFLSLSLSLASSLLSNRLHSYPLSCCCCTSAYADILRLTLVLPLFLSSRLPSSFSLHFLIW